MPLTVTFIGIACGAAKSLLGSTSLISLRAPTLNVRSSLMPVAVLHPQIVQTEQAVRRDLDLGLDVVVVELLEADRRDARLVVDDLLGIAQPGARERDLHLGAALAADGPDRAQRRRGRRTGVDQATSKAASIDAEARRMRSSQTRSTHATISEATNAEPSHRGRRPSGPKFTGSSSQQVLDDLAAVDDLDGPVAGRHQLLVGDDAEQVVDRRGQVFGADRVALGLAGRGVRRAVDRALA